MCTAVMLCVLYCGLCVVAMDDRQETSLIEIMVCCVKQAATGEYPVGRGPNRKVGVPVFFPIHTCLSTFGVTFVPDDIMIYIYAIQQTLYM